MGNSFTQLQVIVQRLSDFLVLNYYQKLIERVDSTSLLANLYKIQYPRLLYHFKE